MNAAVKGQQPVVTPGKGDIRLLASTAQVHGERLRYEPQPQKNTLGFWTRMEDWASWDFDVAKAGRYEVEIQQGCSGGGSEVAVEIAGLVTERADTRSWMTLPSRVTTMNVLLCGTRTAVPPMTPAAR